MDVKVEVSVISLTAKAVNVKQVKAERFYLKSDSSIVKNTSFSFAPIISIGGHSISAVNPENIEFKELAVSV